MFIHVDYRLCVFSVLGIDLRTLTHTKHWRPQLHPQPTALNTFDSSWLCRDAEPTGTEGQPPCILWLHQVLLDSWAAPCDFCRIASFSTRMGVSFVGFSLCPAERSTPRYWTVPSLRTFSMDSMRTIVEIQTHRSYCNLFIDLVLNMCSFQMLLWARSLQSAICITVNDSSWPHLPDKVQDDGFC